MHLRIVVRRMWREVISNPQEVKTGQVWLDTSQTSNGRQVRVDKVVGIYAYTTNIDPNVTGKKVNRVRIAQLRKMSNYRLIDTTEHPKTMNEPMEAPAVEPYLTVIPDRTPRQKAHTSLGQARKAVLFRLDINDKLSLPCRIYKWSGLGWELLWDIPADTERKAMPWLALTPSPKA